MSKFIHLMIRVLDLDRSIEFYFRSIGDRMVEKTRGEDGVDFYGFSFSGQYAHCREGFRDAAGILAHLKNVDELLSEALNIASLERLEVHAPAAEVDALRGPMKELNPTFHTMATGFRRS